MTAMNLEELQNYVSKESESFGDDFVPIAYIPKHRRPGAMIPFRVVRNNRFLVQLYRVDAGVIRISVNKAEIVGLNPENGPIWADGITWDQLQDIKSKLGYGHRDAVEIYPKDEDVVNVANIRHLWVLSEHSMNFVWRKK